MKYEIVTGSLLVMLLPYYQFLVLISFNTSQLKNHMTNYDMMANWKNHMTNYDTMHD